MAEVGLVGVRTAGGQLPSNGEEGERFPDLDCLQHTTTEGASESQSTRRAVHSFGRPPSLSVYSVASSASTYSDGSTWSSSRRDSITSSLSTTSCASSGTECIIPVVVANNPPPVAVDPVVPVVPVAPVAPVVPPSGPVPRSRRDAKQLHAARLQRSGSTSLALAKKRDQKKNRFKRAATPAEALAATEPPHEQGLTRMAYAEQQRWITVQQKTFTKWLNTKIEVRNLEVKDLVQDLSDGVSLVPNSLPLPLPI